MNKMPIGYRFKAWLINVWFGSFEGGMVRDTWKRKFQQEEQDRILHTLRHWDSFTNDMNQFQDEMRRACDIGFEYGEQAATERIIKLLEEYFEAWFALENPNAYDTGRTDGLASAIALIKGEQK